MFIINNDVKIINYNYFYFSKNLKQFYSKRTNWFIILRAPKNFKVGRKQFKITKFLKKNFFQFNLNINYKDKLPNFTYYNLHNILQKNFRNDKIKVLVNVKLINWKKK